MDKNILVQYFEMKEEIKDIRRRIDSLDKEIQKLEKLQVSDSVKGSRGDYDIYGPIKIKGVPVPAVVHKKATLTHLKHLLEVKETELLELTCKAEEYISSVNQTEMRMILQFKFIDGMTNLKVAESMNQAFPKRKVKYTDENIKKRIQRFFENFENVPQCPLQTC